jgi:hypothetical protein
MVIINVSFFFSMSSGHNPSEIFHERLEARLNTPASQAVITYFPAQLPQMDISDIRFSIRLDVP